MASYVSQQSKLKVYVAGSFDCGCGGRAVVKGWWFKNRWHKKAADGIARQEIMRYYAQCLCCGEVTSWKWTAEEAKKCLLSGKVISGRLTSTGKSLANDLSKKKSKMEVAA